MSSRIMPLWTGAVYKWVKLLLVCSLLVGETTGGGFETLGGDKTHCFITRTKAYKQLTQKLNNTRPLSFSLVFLSILST
jgi:hypothetical protein